MPRIPTRSLLCNHPRTMAMWIVFVLRNYFEKQGNDFSEKCVHKNLIFKAYTNKRELQQRRRKLNSISLKYTNIWIFPADVTILNVGPVSTYHKSHQSIPIHSDTSNSYYQPNLYILRHSGRGRYHKDSLKNKVISMKQILTLTTRTLFLI